MLKTTPFAFDLVEETLPMIALSLAMGSNYPLQLSGSGRILTAIQQDLHELIPEASV